MPMQIPRGLKAALKLKPPKAKPETAKSAATRPRPPRNKGGNTARPPEQDAFTRICAAALHTDCVKEYRFHPTRKWRFDYALPAYRIALEVEGGVWTGGRHTSPQGFLGDMEKYNAATLMGWRLFRVTPQQQYTKATVDLLRQALANTAADTETGNAETLKG